MKRGLIFLFLGMSLICVGAPRSVHAEDSIREPAASIPKGEHLFYTIAWLKIPVGIGELRVKEKVTTDSHEVIPVEGVIKTNRVLSKIFPIHDDAGSWIDAKTLESVRFEKEIREIIIKTREKMVFDAAAGKGYFESFKTGEKKEFAITPPVHDVLSAFYWIRRQELVPGTSVKTYLIADAKKWELEAYVRGRESVKIHGEKKDTLRVDLVSRVEGEEKRGKSWFFVTEDDSHTPLRIVYKAPFGNLVGTLTEPE